MIRELDGVVLMRDLPEHGLRAGDVGVVVHVYGEGIGFEVEFVTGDGKTVAVVTLSRDADPDLHLREGRLAGRRRPPGASPRRCMRRGPPWPSPTPGRPWSGGFAPWRRAWGRRSSNRAI
jgi:hypothetical protein